MNANGSHATANSDPNRLQFSWRGLARWLIARTVRVLRTKQPRYYVRSLPHLKTQFIVDTQNGDAIAVSLRDKIDAEVMRQVFLEEDYRLQRLQNFSSIQRLVEHISAAGRRPLILDLGANIGLASMYFAREFPKARILAVEPNPENAMVARSNVRGLQNVTVVEAGIASTDGTARMVDPGLGSWGFRTELSNQGSTPMLSVQTLMAQTADEGLIPFIAKIDIEGFEHDLFSQNLEWADCFPILIIELHDWMLPGQGTARNFLRWAASRDRDFVYFGENVFSLKPSMDAEFRDATSANTH